MNYSYSSSSTRGRQEFAAGVVAVSIALLVFGVLSSFSGSATSQAAPHDTLLQPIIATPAPIIIVATPTPGSPLASRPASGGGPSPQESHIRIIVATPTSAPDEAPAPAPAVADVAMVDQVYATIEEPASQIQYTDTGAVLLGVDSIWGDGQGHALMTAVPIEQPPPAPITIVNPCGASRGAHAEQLCQQAHEKAQVP